MYYKRTYRPILDFQLYLPFITIQTELMNEHLESRSFTYILLSIAIYKWHWHFRLWNTTNDKEVDESKENIFTRLKNWFNTVFRKNKPSLELSSKDLQKIADEYKKLYLKNITMLNRIAREIDPTISKDKAVSGETLLLIIQKHKLESKCVDESSVIAEDVYNNITTSK